jgi:hypothetical protein
VTNAGLVLTQSVDLPHRGRWFFAATAYSTNGLESDFSSEVSWESKPLPPAMAGERWVRLAAVYGRSTNLTTWGSVTGEATWFPATNRAEFFRVNGLLMERVMVHDEHDRVDQERGPCRAMNDRWFSSRAWWWRNPGAWVCGCSTSGDRGPSRRGTLQSLRGVVAEQSAANAKLIVCLDNNTKVLEECRDELRLVRMERKQV